MMHRWHFCWKDNILWFMRMCLLFNVWLKLI